MRVSELDGIKIGDFVITTNDRDRDGCLLFPVGTRGRIDAIEDDNDCVNHYRIYDGNTTWWYRKDMFVLAKGDCAKIIFAIDRINDFKDELYKNTFCLYERDDKNRVINWDNVKEIMVDFTQKMVEEFTKGE